MTIDVKKLREAFELLAHDLDESGDEPPWGWEHQRSVALERFASAGLAATEPSESDGAAHPLMYLDAATGEVGQVPRVVVQEVTEEMLGRAMEASGILFDSQHVLAREVADVLNAELRRAAEEG